jgi:hypothetical protein
LKPEFLFGQCVSQSSQNLFLFRCRIPSQFTCALNCSWLERKALHSLLTSQTFIIILGFNLNLFEINRIISFYPACETCSLDALATEIIE